MADTDIQDHLAVLLAEPPRRVRLLSTDDGQRFWLKRVERLSGRLRWQKGDPLRAFAAERAGLRALGEAGLPVAAIADEGPDWMLLPDAGPILPEVIADAGRDVAEKIAACRAAGRALGRLHASGMVHGRPAVRDICWDGQEARFIDLERFRIGRKSGFWQAADVVMFVQTAFTRWPDDPRWVDAAMSAYAEAAPPGSMRRVGRLARRLVLLDWLAAGLSRLRPSSRELRAVGLTLGWLRRH